VSSHWGGSSYLGLVSLATSAPLASSLSVILLNLSLSVSLLLHGAGMSSIIRLSPEGDALPCYQTSRTVS
jgi:hypothetical protein